MLTLEDALMLTRGATLRFDSSAALYLVTGVEPLDVRADGKARGVRLSLTRDDGYETHASTHDLRKASVAEPLDTPPSQSPELDAHADDPGERDQPVKRSRRTKA